MYNRTTVRRRKFASAFCVVVCLILMAADTVPLAANADLYAKSFVLMDGRDKSVVISKDKDEALMPASLTKLMTVLLVLEEGNLQDRVVMSQKSAALAVSGSAHINSKAGEVFSVEDLVYAALLRSANDAAAQLAEYVDGSTDAFVRRMNERAVALGCRYTTFLNATGLPEEGHVSTAFDLALIGQACLCRRDFCDMASAYRYCIQRTNFQKERMLYNRNPLYASKTYRYEGVIGGKTGRAEGVKSCLLTLYRRDGRELICCTLGEPFLLQAVCDQHLLYDQYLSNL